jgi:hypothetical protein
MYDLLFALVFVGVVAVPAIFAARSGARATDDINDGLLLPPVANSAGPDLQTYWPMNPPSEAGRRT